MYQTVAPKGSIILVYELYTAVRSQNALIRKIFEIPFLYISYLTKHFYLVPKKIFAEKLLQCTSCDQTLYITNVCRVKNRITKVALLI